MNGRSAAQEWRDGWPMVFAAFVGFLSFSVMISAMSAFMGPLAEEFGWGRTILSAGTGMSSIVTMFAVPFIGVFIDRYGPRRIALPGVALSALAVVAMASNTGSQTLWIMLWLFYALAGLFVNTPVWTLAVSEVFEKSRGLALAVALAGATAAHAMIPPISVALIDAVGWRMAFVLLGSGFGVVAFIVCFAFFHDTRSKGQRKAAREPDAAPARTIPLTGLTLAEAWRNTALWRIGASILIIMTLTIGFLVHQIEILFESGVSRGNAAGLAGVAGAMGIVGKLVTGWLIDRFPGNWVGGLTMACAGLAFYLLVGGGASTTLVFIAMLVNGYTAGAKLHIASYLTVQYCGLLNFGKIYGAISSLVAVGSGIGPILAGAVYDALGSYEPFLTGGAVALTLSALLLLSLPRYPDWSAKGAEPVPA